MIIADNTFICRSNIVDDYNNVILRCEFKGKKKLQSSPITVLIIENKEEFYKTISYYPTITKPFITNITQKLIEKYHADFPIPTQEQLVKNKETIPREETVFIDVDYDCL
jgi:hypothetical protein